MSFEFSSQDQYMVINIRGEGTGTETPSIDRLYEQHLKGTGLKFVVINCAECGTMSLLFLRNLALIYKRTKDLNGKVVLINVSQEIHDRIRSQGLDRLLLIRSTLKGALVECGLAKAREFDVNFINPFISATQKTLEVQCSVSVTPHKPYVKKPSDPPLLGDLSGIIGIVSETFSGSLAISFPEQLFLKMANKLLGLSMAEITPEVVDFVGELSNIILGQAKGELNNLGYKIHQAIPSCIWGKDHKIKSFGSGVCVVIPFETEDGIFHIEVFSSNLAAALQQG